MININPMNFAAGLHRSIACLVIESFGLLLFGKLLMDISGKYSGLITFIILGTITFLSFHFPLIRLKLNSAAPCHEPELEPFIRSITRHFNLPDVHLHWTDSSSSISIIGTHIMIGRSVVDQLTPEELKMAIAHELGHLAGLHPEQEQILAVISNFLIAMTLHGIYALGSIHAENDWQIWHWGSWGFGILTTLLMLTFSRTALRLHHEHHADDFAFTLIPRTEILASLLGKVAPAATAAQRIRALSHP